VVVEMIVMMIQTESVMVRRAWRMAFIATVTFELAAHAGAPSDATEYRRIEGDDNEDGYHDWTNDHKRHVENEVDVSPLRQHVAVRQLTARPTTVHYADGEGREAGEGEAGEHLGEDDSTGVWDGDDEWSAQWVEHSDESLHGERGHQPRGQQPAGVRQVTDGDARYRGFTHHLQYRRSIAFSLSLSSQVDSGKLYPGILPHPAQPFGVWAADNAFIHHQGRQYKTEKESEKNRKYKTKKIAADDSVTRLLIFVVLQIKTFDIYF